MSPAAPIEPGATTLQESSSSSSASSPDRADSGSNRRFRDLRGVRWRIDLGIFPSSSSSSIDDLRRVAANSRRSYAALRRRLLIDPHIPDDGNNIPDLVIDNPLSQNPDSMWGRFFQKAELEKMVDQDLSRLYPEHGSYFQTPGCQGVLRRILLLWCIRHPNYGYRQGMHELLAPLLYVLQSDVKRLSDVRKSYDDYFTDNFDGLSFDETDSAYKSNLKKVSQRMEDGVGNLNNQPPKVNNLNELDPKIRTVVAFSDAYGAEGELGVVLSEKFIEHDAYCMFEALMNGSGGAVAMAAFFSPSPLAGSQNGLPPVIEASSALYRLLSVVDSSLHAHLVELGVEPQYFALRWLRVLFGREFALDDLLVIWDEIFAFNNDKLNVVSGNDLEFGSGVLSSSRGAFISALAVSMMLYVRSSLLATETATSCLQRLLNFPADVSLGKLLKKANSLVGLAVDTVNSIPPAVPTDGCNSSGARRHSLSSDAAAPGSLLGSYWEEKWRVLLKEEEQKQASPQNRTKGWSEKVKLRLSRAESTPSSSKVEKTDPARLPVRRSLLDDLARQLGSEADGEKPTGEDDGRKRCLSGNGGSEEDSSVFSDPSTPTGGPNHNDHENDTERSSVASNSSVYENEQEPRGAAAELEVGSPLPVSDAPEDSSLKAAQNGDSPVKPGAGVRDRNLLAGRFQWIWKLGRNGVEGGCGSDATKASAVVGCDQTSRLASSTTDVGAPDTVDQNTKLSLKNLGHSMLENIQVIESVLEQDKAESQRGSTNNTSKNDLVGRGQTTAMAALKELRKISNILSEI